MSPTLPLDSWTNNPPSQLIIQSLDIPIVERVLRGISHWRIFVPPRYFLSSPIKLSSPPITQMPYQILSKNLNNQQ